MPRRPRTRARGTASHRPTRSTRAVAWSCPPQGCLMANSVAALSAQDEDVRTRACPLYDETLALFTRRITEARDSGEIDEDIDPESTARALIAVRQGIEFLHKAGLSAEELQRAKNAALEMIERSVGR
ncbi:TetR family transcriptional regulator C-terminal domain-containing protein [Amycolatopsis thermoflava]|uniref:TetR family transcriptional regulator C-terminal domain-containing protein n=1 Tax=Amycolatopsis thermoflava TaxID=84480 RepID=UPI0039774D1F